MRRRLLLVLVLLLTLRGWVGDAMAGQMLPQGATVAAVQTVNADEHDHSHAAAHGHGHDCDEHAQAPPANGHAQPQASADCSTCASCQMCSSMGLTPPLAAEAQSVFSQPLPQTVQAAYASAERALAFKPPRS